MWRIEITPSADSGDGRIRLQATETGAVGKSALILEDHRKVFITAETSEELCRGVAYYGLLTGRLAISQDWRWDDTDSTPDPPGSEKWTLAQWQEHWKLLDAAVKEFKANPERFRIGPDGKTPQEREEELSRALDPMRNTKR